MAQWFIVRAGNEEGPISDQQLKALAASGKLRPTDLVRRDDMKTTLSATKIKGLFSNQSKGGGHSPAVSAATRSSSPAKTSAQDSPSPTANSKRKRIILAAAGAACLLLCCGGIGVFGIKMKGSAQKDIAEADAAWDAGRKADAVEKYRSALGARAHFLNEKARPRVYGRVVDFDLERGDKESAKTILAEAARNKVTPLVNHPASNALLAAERGEVLTADFYPHKKGARYQTFQKGRFGDSGVEIEIKREYLHLDDGIIESRTLQMTMIGPARREVPFGPPAKLFRREKNGFLEVGKNEEVTKDFIFWTPLIKIGAVVGDEWDGGSLQNLQRANSEFTDGPKPHLKLIGFSQESLSPNLIASGKVLCATIEETFTSNGQTGVTEHILGKGIGQIRKRGSEVKSGVRRETFTESIQPTTRP